MRLRNRRERREGARPQSGQYVGLVELLESFELGDDRQAIVTRLGSRYFVIRGERDADYSTYEVSFPHDSHYDAHVSASGDAIRVHQAFTTYEQEP